MPSKILTVYYSYSGNTRKVAEEIRKSVGGDLFEIQTVNQYPNEYNAVVAQAKKELESEFKPKLSFQTPNLDDYDTVFLGSPNWWHTVAPPIVTFLSENDLTGKKIAPFCTHGGGGAANCFSDVKKMASQATVLSGIAFRDDKASSNEIANWLQKILK